MSFNLMCPYCGEECAPCDDCREPDQNIEKHCVFCDKIFLYKIEYMPSYSAWEAPCMNDGDHSYKQIIGAPAEHFKGRKRCEYCDDEIKEIQP